MFIQLVFQTKNLNIILNLNHFSLPSSSANVQRVFGATLNAACKEVYKTRIICIKLNFTSITFLINYLYT